MSCIGLRERLIIPWNRDYLSVTGFRLGYLEGFYTEMSQFAHQLSNSYLNLPTDCWVPSTSRIRPMRSRQVAGGIYMKLPWNLSMDIEGYFRITDRMLEYDTGGNLTLACRITGEMGEVAKENRMDWKPHWRTVTRRMSFRPVIRCRGASRNSKIFTPTGMPASLTTVIS